MVLAISEVEVVELQHCDLVLLCSYCDIPFRRYTVTMVYSKSLGTLSRLTVSARGGM
jgi:hypothetical protein